MGIADRAYYREEPRSRGFGLGGGRGSLLPGRLSVITWLVIINVGIFAIDLLLPVKPFRDYREVSTTASQQQIERALPLQVPNQALPPPGAPWRQPLVDPVTNQIVGADIYRRWHILNGFGHFSLLKGFLQIEVWRVVTYQFLHANFIHLFFNMFGLYMFGGMVEQYLGRKKFLSFYLLCGIGGGLLYLILVGLAVLGVPLPGTLAQTTIGTPLIGASAGVFGVIIACAKISPNQSVMLIFPPIPLKLKWLAYGYVAVAAYNLISGGNNAGGDAAHIGGAIAGFFFIRRIHLLRGFLDFGLGPAPKGPASVSNDTRHQKKIDRILEKVHAKGMHSLTKREEKLLRQSSGGGRR